MNAAMDWMTDRRRNSNRWSLSDFDLQMPPSEPAVSSGTTSVPVWQHKVVSRLLDLIGLQDNWDSYGASRPSATSAIELVNVLGAVMAIDTPAPSIVPSPHGHFQAEWHVHGVDLEVEVIGPTRILVSFSDAHESWDREVGIDFTHLVQAVRRIGGAQ
jgi:hypothetical protein